MLSRRDLIATVPAFAVVPKGRPRKSGGGDPQLTIAALSVRRADYIALAMHQGTL